MHVYICRPLSSLHFFISVYCCIYLSIYIYMCVCVFCFHMCWLVTRHRGSGAKSEDERGDASEAEDDD